MTPDRFSKIVLDEIAASDPDPKKLVFHFVFLGARRMKIGGLARLVVSTFAFLVTVRLNSAELSPPKLVVPYGENVAAGKTVVLNGIRLYYETYGQGPPMLLIDGNGQSIGAMAIRLISSRPITT